MTNASYREADDHHSDVREGEALEASELSYRRWSLLPRVKSILDSSGNTMDMVSNNTLAAVAQAIDKSRSRGISLLIS